MLICPYWHLSCTHYSASSLANDNSSFSLLAFPARRQGTTTTSVSPSSSHSQHLYQGQTAHDTQSGSKLLLYGHRLAAARALSGALKPASALQGMHGSIPCSATGLSAPLSARAAASLCLYSSSLLPDCVYVMRCLALVRCSQVSLTATLR